MGWTVPYNTPTKAALVELLLSNLKQAGNIVLAHKLMSKHVWMVVQLGERAYDPQDIGKKFITCYLMTTDGRNWGYKEVDETSGSLDYDCPLSFLRMAEDFAHVDYSPAWRKAVREAHAKKKAAASIILKHGMAVQLFGVAYHLEGPYRTRGYWVVRRDSDGTMLRARISHIRAAIAESKVELGGLEQGQLGLTA